MADDLPTWATPEQIADADAALRRMDKDAAELGRLARLIAGDDERLHGQLARAMTSAYFLGRRTEWEEHAPRRLSK